MWFLGLQCRMEVSNGGKTTKSSRRLASRNGECVKLGVEEAWYCFETESLGRLVSATL